MKEPHSSACGALTKTERETLIQLLKKLGLSAEQHRHAHRDLGRCKQLPDIEFDADVDTIFVLGSAVPHNHDLVLGNYSVHTSQSALQKGEAEIRRLREQYFVKR